MTTPTRARLAVQQHHQRRLRITQQAVAVATEAWEQVRPDDLTQSWREALPQVLATVAAAQYASAAASSGYVASTLAEATGQSVAAVMRTLGGDGATQVIPEAFSGITGDGRPLESLLYLPVPITKSLVLRGRSVDQALTTGKASLAEYVGTEVVDAGRVADGVAITAQPEIAGHERVVHLPACGRCIILAGRLYRWSDGFQRHPQCLPAGVAVSGPSVRAATRRWYEGELVIITTASGQELPITCNHPVLTDRGWLPAHLLQEGDHVIRSVLGQGAVPLTVPNEQQMPSLIEDVGRSRGMITLGHMPTSTEDFHGDGGYGEVNVVLSDRLLGSYDDSTVYQPSVQQSFPFGVASSTLFAERGSTFQMLNTVPDASNSLMRVGGLGGSLPGSHLGSASNPGIAVASSFDTCFNETTLDHLATYSESIGEAVLALAGSVGGDDLFDRQPMSLTPRWDAPALPFSAENAGSYASRGLDLGRRITGQVERDRIVEVRRVSWSGHVYNLDSSEGWYSANGLVVSNCDCTMRPVTEDEWREQDEENTPEQLFERMTAEQQAKAFTNAGAQAIRDGADISQVINARRGMSKASVGGRKVLTTTEGTTRRGVAGKRLGSTAKTKKSGSGVTRLMPEECYAAAGGDRDEAIRLLKRNGYIT